MQSRSIYAILIGVGDYREVGAANLTTYKMDLALFGNALMSGLKIPGENIRIIAGRDNNGFVTAKNLARALAEFESTIGTEDTLIFYFSGHGRNQNIIFSNGQMELQSVVNYLSNIRAKTKLVVLDCCYSGDFKNEGARLMRFEESMSDFAGKGIAVFASSSADEVSRLGPGENHSMFTGALSSAIALKKKI